MRYVVCVLPCPARERRANEVSKRSQIERWLALAAGESVLSSESCGERPVDARKRPNGDRRKVRSLAGLSQVKGCKSSFRASGRGQCGVLKTLTATEIVVHREGMKIAPYLGPDKFDLLLAARELARDMQMLSMLSTLKLRRFAWYPIGAADVSQFFAYSDETGTMLVWTDADLSGNESIDVQINVRWCCAAGVLWDRSEESASAGGVVQLG